MNIVSFVHEGLGNSSYLLEAGDGEALLVDPDRSVQRYLDAARARTWNITRVFETHLHADFVSGALEMRAATGAELFVPEAARARFPHRPVRSGDHVPTATGSVSTIASPGHTPEHTSYAFQANGHVPALFSGGSLLVGGAARTDLVSSERTAPLTASQYQTITAAFKDLPDETRLLPTHGGGSFCSTGNGGERSSTLGVERRTNQLLLQSEEEFLSRFPATFPAAPRYFFRLRPINQAGSRLRSTIASPPSLPPHDFDAFRRAAAVIDVRPQADFMAGHIPGAMSNAFRDSFATWLGWLLPQNVPLLFVLGDEPLEQVVDECLLVGYERFFGVLDGGMPAWSGAGYEVARGQLTDAQGTARLLAEGALALDVREANEFGEGHIPGALHIPLGELDERLAEVPKDRLIVTYCGHGERSATALSVLERLGFSRLVNFDGGFGSWCESGLKVDR